MLNSYYTEKLLGLQGVEIKNVEEKEKKFEILIELPRKTCICPCCGAKTNRIHYYRYQRIKELPAFEKKVILVFHKRRYVRACGKRFAEPNTFLAKYQRMTTRAIMGLLEKLRDSRSYTSVAREFDISASTVIRFFKSVQYSKPMALLEVIGIDKFKGNSGGEKFHGTLIDIGEKRS